MKAVVLAAGKGVRMMPLTDNCPKVLISIKGKPFLWYLLDHLVNAGYTDIALIVGYKWEQIDAFVKDHKFPCTLIKQNEQLGTGHAASLVKEFIQGENFVLLAGDHLWSVHDLERMKIEDNLQYIAGLHKEDPQHYGVLVTEGDVLKEIREKPQEFVGDLINISLYKFTPSIFDALEKIEKSPRGEYEITDAVTILAKEGMVRVVSLEDYWINLGTIQDIPLVQEQLQSI